MPSSKQSVPINSRIIPLVLVGNLLDYYDFMLFAHLGAMLTGRFIPNLDPTQTHLLSLLLFAIPFVIRPFGGYLFGAMSDKFGRSLALNQTLKFASIASLGIAILPGYETGGMISALLFIVLRTLQGLSLGGEYTTAGTLLMEKYSHHRSLLSGLVGASGTVGSLIAFGFSWFYLQDYFSDQAWRYAFGLGGILTYVSFAFRQSLQKEMLTSTQPDQMKTNVSHQRSILITVLVGLLIGVIFWFPMVYANFYLTKILHYPQEIGLMATLIALFTSILMTPIFGHLADRFTPQKIMTLAAFLTIPLSLMGFQLLESGNLWGQVILVSSVALFGAPAHALINPLFNAQRRSRYVNTCFMIGASLGSLAPFVSGFLSSQLNLHHAPVVMISVCGSVTFVVFYHSFYRNLKA